MNFQSISVNEMQDLSSFTDPKGLDYKNKVKVGQSARQRRVQELIAEIEENTTPVKAALAKKEVIGEVTLQKSFTECSASDRKRKLEAVRKQFTYLFNTLYS